MKINWEIILFCSFDKHNLAIVFKISPSSCVKIVLQVILLMYSRQQQISLMSAMSFM